VNITSWLNLNFVNSNTKRANLVNNQIVRIKSRGLMGLRNKIHKLPILLIKVVLYLINSTNPTIMAVHIKRVKIRTIN